jgi:hypothetical protein
MRWEIVLADRQRRFEELLQDCINGDLDKIARADVSLINNVKSLICAIEHHKYDVLRLLLNKGADPNSSLRWYHDRNHKYYIDTTPLIEAIKISDLESIKILLDNGADINFCAERNLSDIDAYFNKARIRVKEPSDDLYIKPGEKRTDDEKMYILKYETGELVNVSPIQIAYNYHHDSIVDYLLSRGATMKVNIRPTGIFPFPFTTLGEMLRRCKLYFIKQVGLCEEQYFALRTQVREFESTKELLRDWETSNSAPYPRLFIPAAQLLPDISHEFKSQYIALCSLFILEYWNATINSKTHIAAMADVDVIGYKICQIILWREIYPSHR